MILLVCGLSMSGKSTLIAKADLARLAVEHVRASAVLHALDRPTVGLAVTDLLANQVLLVEWLMQSLGGQPRSIILDGHLLVETADGPQLVPDNALRVLPIAGVIAIHDDPLLVSERRKETPLTTRIEEIQDLTTIEELQAKRFARLRGVEFAVVRAADVTGFEAMVHRCFVTKTA
jgi:adenylate kinase